MISIIETIILIGNALAILNEKRVLQKQKNQMDLIGLIRIHQMERQYLQIGQGLQDQQNVNSIINSKSLFTFSQRVYYYI
ncbi:hypothetical protein pb186bvf_008272 [Paramecium bursaria]